MELFRLVKIKKEENLGIYADKPNHYFVYTDTVLNVRKKPSQEGEILGTLERGIEVKFLEKTSRQETIQEIAGAWWKIEAHGKEGYVFSGYLSRYKPMKGKCYSFEF